MMKYIAIKQSSTQATYKSMVVVLTSSSTMIYKMHQKFKHCERTHITTLSLTSIANWTSSISAMI